MSKRSGRHKASQNNTEQLGQIPLTRSILRIAIAYSRYVLVHDKQHLYLHSYLGNYRDSILNRRIGYILNIEISLRAIVL